MQVETTAGRSTAEFRVEGAEAQLLQHLRSGLAAQARFTLVAVQAGEVRLSARPNWATWGARILLRIAPSGEAASTVRARWEPAVPTTAVTWGQGARDLRALEQLLQG